MTTEQDFLRSISRTSVDIARSAFTPSHLSQVWPKLQNHQPINPFWVSSSKSILVSDRKLQINFPVTVNLLLVSECTANMLCYYTFSLPTLFFSHILPTLLHTLQVYTINKKACFFGRWQGSGFIVRVTSPLDAKHMTFSYPLFITLSGWSLGLSFGAQSSSTLALCLSTEAVNRLLQLSPSPSRNNPPSNNNIMNGTYVSGIELSACCGRNKHQERADMTSATIHNSSLKTVGFSTVSGCMLDMSYVRIHITIDQDRNKQIYGVDKQENMARTPGSILYTTNSSGTGTNSVGGVGGDNVGKKEEEGMEGFYNHIRRMSAGVEVVPIGPSRASASLERMTSGRDPERAVVL